MRRILAPLALLLAALLSVLPAGRVVAPVEAQATPAACQFVLGFATIRALLSPQQHTTITWLRQLSLLVAKGVDVQTAEAGQLMATVLNPPSPLVRPSDVEDNSVVLLLTFGSTHWLFTGDITRQGEAETVARRLAAGQPWPAIDILKSPTTARPAARRPPSWPLPGRSEA
ncbi:MAG: hypothetical protein ACRDJN_11815 [Chloroflexota bacterium]